MRWAKPGFHISSSPTASLGEQLFCSFKTNGEEVGRVLVACSCVSQTCRKNLSKQAHSSCNETIFFPQFFVGKSGFKTPIQSQIACNINCNLKI